VGQRLLYFPRGEMASIKERKSSGTENGDLHRKLREERSKVVTQLLHLHSAEKTLEHLVCAGANRAEIVEILASLNVSPEPIPL
jgi:hypothetical protein